MRTRSSSSTSGPLRNSSHLFSRVRRIKLAVQNATLCLVFMWPFLMVKAQCKYLPSVSHRVYLHATLLTERVCSALGSADQLDFGFISFELVAKVLLVFLSSPFRKERSNRLAVQNASFSAASTTSSSRVPPLNVNGGLFCLFCSPGICGDTRHARYVGPAGKGRF